jgi:murein L,D-transpeptidase YcbB/YkuD
MQSDYQTTQWFAFEQRLPVHLVYWTAWIDEWERTQFRSDIYQLSPGVKVATQAQMRLDTEWANKPEPRSGGEAHLLGP